MQCRIERALLHLQDVAGNLLKPLRDGVAVNRPESDDFEDEDVERPLQEVRFRRVRRHAMTIYIYICRMSRRQRRRQPEDLLVVRLIHRDDPLRAEPFAHHPPRRPRDAPMQRIVGQHLDAAHRH